MLMINGTETLQKTLSAALGLPSYQYIMEKVRQTNVVKDEDFQRTFNGFYKIRRNDVWRKSYYNAFEYFKKQEDVSFEDILCKIYEDTGMIEASFASKMLATLDENMPIWDSKVLKVLDFSVKVTNPQEKIDTIILTYGKIVRWYEEYLDTDEAKENLRIFDAYLPDYIDISAVKKIDYMLWALG